MTEQLPSSTQEPRIQNHYEANRLASASPSDIRLRNRTAIMRALYPHASFSRAELAKLTGLSKVSTSDVVGELIEDGLLVEGSYKPLHGPGKPALSLGFNPLAGNIITIDLSDVAHIRGAVVDLVGSVIHRMEIAMPHSNTLDIAEVITLCKRLSAMSDTTIIGIAVATPGTVNDEGLVLEAPNLGWVNMNLPQELQCVADCPIVVTNDADAAVFAERYFGGGPCDIILVQIAEGVGAGLLIADHVVHGKGFTAGEIGHVVMQDGDQPCVCGKTGCLETMISAPVLEAAIRRDPQARETILAHAGHILGQALAMPVALTNITQVVISGIPHLVDDALVDATQHTIDALTHSRFLETVHVQRSHIGEDASMLGAAGLVLRRVLAVL